MLFGGALGEFCEFGGVRQRIQSDCTTSIVPCDLCNVHVHMHVKFKSGILSDFPHEHESLGKQLYLYNLRVGVLFTGTY